MSHKVPVKDKGSQKRQIRAALDTNIQNPMHQKEEKKMLSVGVKKPG
jgi:hypothetical protein